MHESMLRAGDAVTVRKGALPAGRPSRRLPADIRGRVVSVTGRAVQVEAEGGYRDEDGTQLAMKFLTFDQSYVYRRG